MKRRLLAGLVPLALALSGPVQADIYAFVDSNGVRHLSNVPNDPRYKLVMRTPAYSKQSAQVSSYAPTNLYGPGDRNLSNLRNSTQKAARTRPFRVNEQNRQRFTPDVNRIAAQYRLDPALMHAVISAESSYNPWAVSPKGAMGLMQLMPGTAERFGVNNPYDPIANMHGGARYLRWLLDQFNDTRLAVAAYNAGEGAVQKYGNQIPPYQETQTYVVRVLNFYQQYRLNGPYTAGSYNTVAYNTGSRGSPLALNNSYSSGSAGYRSGSGVTIITPRANGRSSGPIMVTSSSGPATIPSTYLTPTGTRIIVGGSGDGNRGASRPAVKVNPPARATKAAATPLFAGNDK
jgi:soluble lytic murein transglycosylase-like protein